MSLVNTFKKLSISRFLEEIETQNFFWIAKRLSGNDTGLTGAHQVGLYLPRIFFESVMPEICTTAKHNPELFIDECYFPDNDISLKKLRAIYYNSKYFPELGLKKKYDEFRITRWQGKSSPVQDKENTGSIIVFAVKRQRNIFHAVAWVASTVGEEDIIESWLGEEVEPARFYMSQSRILPKRIKEFELPSEWFSRFPSGRDIFKFVKTALPRSAWDKGVDALLLKRRDLEFKIFEQIEISEVLPKVKKGFSSVDAFIKLAHSVSNRRKSRTGASLELNLEAIFQDEKLIFETQAVTENRKKPDFLFPTQKAYHSLEFPALKLNMLASKTCCKDRWRQILNEANRIKIKHLFTLQQGVSSHQLQEMKDNNVVLVVPKPYLSSFAKDCRTDILTLESFISVIKAKQTGLEKFAQWIR